MRPRLVPAVLAVASACLATTLFTVPAASAAACTRTGHDGKWDTAVPPRFTSGTGSISEYAVSGASLFVTNGTQVLRTTNGGCDWQQVFQVANPTDVVHSIVAPDQPGGRSVYLAINSSLVAATGAVPAVVVARSGDRGSHWEPGAAVPGVAVVLASGGNDPSALYLVTIRHLASVELPPINSNVDAQVAQVLSASTDGGASWSERHINEGAASVGGTSRSVGNRFIGIGVEPKHADDLWLWGPDGLYQSSDGARSDPPRTGNTFVAQLPVTAGSISRGGVAFAAGGTTFPIVAFTYGKSGKLGALRPPGEVESVVAGPRMNEFAVATKGRVYLHLPSSPPTEPFLDVSAKSARLKRLTANRDAAGFLVYALDGGTIAWRRMPASIAAAKTVVIKKGKGRKAVDQSATLSLDLTKLGTSPPRISPDHLRIGLSVGQRRTVPYVLGLPGSRKVDVFFLVDISNSMEDKIQGLKLALDEIVNRLQKAGVDAWFGVGMYRSYTEGPAYERVADIAPPGAPLLQALSSINASGGGGETHLAALYQSATGKGQDSPSAFIAAGQQAHFRKDALHIVINATDEGFTEKAPQPTYAEVGAALRSVNALQLGIAYESKANDQLQLVQNPFYTPGPSIGQSIVARATKAFAPDNGADCNGDGSPEVLPGEPLVCRVDPADAKVVSAIAPAIVNLVLAAPDFQPVSVTWTAKKPVVRAIAPRVAPAVNLRFPAQLTFNVTYDCPATLPAGVYPAELTARVRGGVVAKAIAAIECSPPVPLAAAAVPFGIGVGTAPAPPTEPVTNAQPQSQPQTQPQSQPQSQSQAQAQLGTAYQEQTDTELAFAYANPVEQGEKSFSFSRYQRTPADGADSLPVYPVVVSVFTGAAALALAYPRRRFATARASSARRRTE